MPTTSSTSRKNLLAGAVTAALLGGGLAFVPSSALAVTAAAPADAVTPFETTDTERTEVYVTAEDLSEEQVANARTIIGVGRGAGITDQGLVIALMTAMQESSLLNLDHGDRDSLGLFQQRPSMGWGSPEQVTDPVYAATSFYGVNPEGENPGLLQIEGWATMPPGDAAQAVQRSAYPDRYAQWEDLARDLVIQNGDVEPIP